MKKIIMDDEIFFLQEKYGGILRLNVDYLNFFKFDNDINFLLSFKFSNNNHFLKIEKKF